MAPAVGTTLAGVIFQVTLLGARRALAASNRGVRPSCGSHRPSQQAEFLAAASDGFSSVYPLPHLTSVVQKTTIDRLNG